MRKLLAFMAVAFALAPTGGPALAGSPVRVTDTTLAPGIPDLDNGLLIFWNTTRDAFCAWVANGSQSPQPAILPITWFVNETSGGAIKVTWGASSHLELWRPDPGVDPSDPCAATQNSVSPWAVGSADVHYTDNDFFVSGSRTDSFGSRGLGTVQGADGTEWKYLWEFRAQYDREGAFRLVAPWQFVLTRVGS